MNKVTFLFIAAAGLLVTSCTNDQDLEKNFNNAQTKQLSTSTRTDATEIELTPQQEDLLLRLAQINDSVASLPEEQVTDNQTRSISWDDAKALGVVAADVKGLYDGFRYGWSKGRTFTGKFATATLSAIVISVAYSAMAAISNSIFHEQSENPYPLTTIQTAIAVKWEEQAISNKFQRLMVTDSDLRNSDTEDELKIALIHNLVLEDLEMGNIYPSNALTDVYSSSQLSFFAGTQYKKFFTAVPQLVEGSVSFSNFVMFDPFPYETQVFNMYISGINNITASNATTLMTKSKALCNEYVKEIYGNSAINQNAQSDLITSIYVAPLSCRHWYLD